MDSVTLIHVEYILRTTCSVHMHFNCIVIYEKYMCTNPQKRSLRRQLKQKILESQYWDEKKNLTSQNRMGIIDTVVPPKRQRQTSLLSG